MEANVVILVLLLCCFCGVRAACCFCVVVSLCPLFDLFNVCMYSSSNFIYVCGVCERERQKHTRKYVYRSSLGLQQKPQTQIATYKTTALDKTIIIIL